MPTVINEAIAARAIAAMKSRRVVLSGFFNSNGLKDGYGVVEAIQQSLVDQGIKIFGAGPVTMTSTNAGTGNNDNNTSTGPNNARVGWSRVVTSGTGANTLLNASNVLALHAFEAKRYNFGRSADGSGVEYPNLYRGLHFSNVSAVNASGVASGINIVATPANALHINAAAALRADFWYSNATAAGGTFRPNAVEGAVPNVALANYGSVITVPAGTPTAMLRGSFDIAAAARNTQVRVGFTSSASFLPTGEVFFGYQMLWERDTTAGVIVAPMVSMGGWSMYDMAYLLARTDGSQLFDEAIDHWIDVLARPAIDAGQDPMFIWMLAEGSNQTGETVVSITQGAAATSWQAWADNTLYIMSRITARWLAKGFKERDLIFALHPDHPRDSTLNVLQIDYRTLGMPYISARFPDMVFGFDGDASWTFAEIMNLGAGTQSMYARNPSAQTITGIAASSGGNCVVTVNNTYAAGDYVALSGTNSTPNIDGTYALVARSGTTITIARGDVTGTGTTGSSRTIDQSHMAVNGISGSTTHAYRTYWSRIVDKWAAASVVIGDGAVGGGASRQAIGL